MIEVSRQGRAVLSALLALFATAPARAVPPSAGGGALSVPVHAASAGQEAAFADEIRAARERLAAAGRLPAADPRATVTLQLPVRARGIGYFTPHATSYYVDQDAAAAQILDWNCGARTFDQHKGTDFFAQPYPWLTMDLSRLEAVAAAPGTILFKSDGEFDRSCTAGASGGNRVVLEHADGTVTGYLQLKNGSLTAKGVGESVAAGEVLGIVGSSGGAAGPHLHFPVYTDDTYTTPLDPYDGPCEALTGASLWASQPADRQPRVNHLSTNFANPIFPACPGQELPNEKRFFADGNTIYFVVFLADEGAAFQKTMQIRRPDGSIFDTWFHTAPSTTNASYWWWTWASFPAGQAGRWTFSITIDGVTRTRAFWIDALFADDFEDANLLAWSAATP